MGRARKWEDRGYYRVKRRSPRAKDYAPKVLVGLLILGGLIWVSYSGVPVELSETVAQVSSLLEVKPVSTDDIEKAILSYTNEERKNHGMVALNWDERLAIVAREHSQDMAGNNFFSHDNLRGEDPTARAKRHGYPIRKELGGGWYSEGIAENIGKMPTGNVVGIGHVARDADEIARAQVTSWMQSPGHRRNILDPDCRRLGVGVAYDGTCYVSTQNFW